AAGAIAAAAAPPPDPAAVAAEAATLAAALVRRTREVNREFRMWGSPRWHNFMIHLGLKEKGFCYHWVPELLRGLPSEPLPAFERHWGLSLMGVPRENNAVVITRRGMPVRDGLVYDAWRGLGRPFWVRAADDPEWIWIERFDERAILAGEAHVEPAE
ncbi:MAG: hypothetical protein HZA54_07650, partial [Planctomycetes bacterium]|nr:hypothetical protein [Planctomycetota bacterium]